MQRNTIIEQKTEADHIYLTPEIMETGIYLLAKNNECKSITKLLKVTNFNVDINKAYYDNGKLKTALQVAVEYGSKEAVALLLKYKNRLNISLPNIKTALSFAKKNNHQDIIQLLADAEEDTIQNKIKSDTVYAFTLNKNSITNLMQLLIPNDDFKTLAELKEMSEYLNIMMDWQSYMYLAIQEGASHAVSLFSDKIENYSLFLSNAIAYHRPQIVKQLVDARADVCIAEEEGGNFPIHLAILLEDEEILQILLESKKVDVNQRNEKQYHLTPAHLTSYKR